MDDEERELEAILGALGGRPSNVYLCAASMDSAMYWVKQLGLKAVGPFRDINCIIVTPHVVMSGGLYLRGRKFGPQDAVYRTAERIGLAEWNLMQIELRRIGWRGNIAKVLG